MCARKGTESSNLSLSAKFPRNFGVHCQALKRCPIVRARGFEEMARLFILHIVFLCFFVSGTLAQTVNVIDIAGSINPATADYIRDQIHSASEARRECLVIRLNTPGGLLKSTRNIVTDLLTAPLPVVVYVSPAGGQAASAGVFITMAAHIAAMAPGTNIGAAHPVTMGDQQDSTMMEKVTNDAAAFIRTISEQRKRNVQWAERAVRKSESLTEREAVKERVVDFLASDLNALLDSLDGKLVTVQERGKIIHTNDAQIVIVEKSTREEILDLLADPNIAYIFMMLGFYGLLFELYNPGSIVPGVVGAIALILAFYSLHTLPINYAGLALIVVAIVLFILEIKVVSHGLLTIGGVIALAIGSLMLIRNDSPWDFIGISWEVILGVTIATAGFFFFAIGMGIRAQQRKPTTGSQGIVGELGVAVTDLQPMGQVRVHGEIWQATTQQGTIERGSTIRVERIEDLRLIVARA